MIQLFELIFVFLFVILTNNIFIKVKDRNVFSLKMFILNLFGFAIYTGVMMKHNMAIEFGLLVLTVGAIIFVSSSANEGFLIAFILQVLGLVLIINFCSSMSFLELTNAQAKSLLNEIPSWIAIYQPFAFVLFILSAVLYSKNPFMKTLTIWLIVYLFVGGNYIRGYENLGPLIFALKSGLLVLLINIIEALGFTELKVLEKINHRPIMVLWILNIINNVFGIFKV